MADAVEAVVGVDEGTAASEPSVTEEAGTGRKRRVGQETNRTERRPCREERKVKFSASSAANRALRRLRLRAGPPTPCQGKRSFNRVGLTRPHHGTRW